MTSTLNEPPLLRHHRFMKQALRLANYALHMGETPVACVFVYNNEIISLGMNNTNETLSGINHAEFRGINVILDKVRNSKEILEHYGKPESIFRDIDLYVTVEPCVMCASALKQIGIRNVYFGCGNERFGGNGSVLHVNKDSTLKANDYLAIPGIYRREAILFLRDFYTRENTKAPVPRSKKNRELNLVDFPELIWGKYITRDEFIEFFGEENQHCYDSHQDVNKAIDLSILDPENTDISDLIEMNEASLSGHPNERKRKRSES